MDRSQGILFFTGLCVWYVLISVWLCTPMDCSPTGSTVHGIFHTKYCCGCHFLLQGIFLTQGANLFLESPALADGLFTTDPPGKTAVSRMIKYAHKIQEEAKGKLTDCVCVCVSVCLCVCSVLSDLKAKSVIGILIIIKLYAMSFVPVLWDKSILL